MLMFTRVNFLLQTDRLICIRIVSGIDQSVKSWRKMLKKEKRLW